MAIKIIPRPAKLWGFAKGRWGKWSIDEYCTESLITTDWSHAPGRQKESCPDTAIIRRVLAIDESGLHYNDEPKFNWPGTMSYVPHEDKELRAALDAANAELEEHVAEHQRTCQSLRAYYASSSTQSMVMK